MNDENLVNFTDVLGDEIPNSQESLPLSLPTSSEKIQIEDHTINMPETIILDDNKTHNIPRPAKGTGQYAEFRSIDEIDIKYRSVFSYPFFNLVQSSVIEDALYSNKSMVVCAPTGSGKTVVFEMAIVQLLMELEDSQRNDDFKIIYMAPVKALCTERLTEWYPKFTKLGLLCIEVTGDTDVDFSQLKPYRIIITTPEKWDMVTRRWREHSQLVEEIKLFLIDEVHILNDEARGPVLEAVVSRMKTIETSAQSAFRIEQLQKQYQGSETSSKSPPKIRFVAVSATVSNPEDVAAWLGTADNPAVYYKFGDECRPVRLKRVVEGYPCPEGTSIFKFDIILNYKLWPVIQKYHDGKPTLIFCNTRKSVALTAETLSKELTVSFSPEQKAKLVTLASTIKNKKLQMLVLSGVGCHHAGLLYEERTSIEHAFRNRDLPILITTTTLAMGVNLPAHLVIIKNTQQYVNGAYQEYSISTVLQMVGRAGRPQFDTEATAVIMTRLCDKPRYQALVGGSEPLQSYLHKRLAENLNSEAALGTVNDVAQCVQWVRSTFLSVRAARDPKRYLGLPQAAPQQLITKKLEELCVKAMNGLASSGMITMDEACCIASTEAGRLMSLYYLDLETMKLIMKINGDENLERLLWLICESHELSDMHLRMDERRILNALNRNNAAPTVRFPMKGKISTRQMKLNCVIQAVLGCLNIPDPSLNQEAMKIMRIADRICKCLVAYVTHPTFISQQPKHYSAILNALILAKCVSAHLWENSPYVSKQLRGIGPTFSTLLATAGKVNFMLLEESHPRDLERIMNKGPPAGNVLRKQISLLPKYQVTMSPIDAKSVAVQLKLLNQSYLCENMGQLTAGDAHKTYLLIGDSENNILFFSSFKDKDLISFYDGIKTHEITRKVDSEHKILVHCVSSTFVGIDAQCEYLFKDLTPGRLGTTCQTNEDFILRPAAKQTHITDTYKERKRRNNIANDISQPKEKKKRDNTIVQKFKSLRESFEKTSKEVKDDFDKSMNFSNEFLQEFTLHDKSKTVMDLGSDQLGTSKTNIETPIQCSNYLPLADITKINSTEQVDYDEKIDLDDEKINNILAEIENEMTKTKKGTNLLRNTKADDIIENIDRSAIPGPSSSHTSAKNIFDYKTYDALNKTRKQFRKTNKLNHKFIDLLDKKIDLSDEEDEVVSNETTGFTNTIKSQIEKYLHKTIHDTNKSKTDIVFCNENEKSERKTIDEKHKTAYEFKNLSKYIDKAETNNENANPSKNIEKLKTNIDKANLSNNMDKTEINIENAVRDKWNIVEIVTQENFNDYRKQDTKEGNMDNWCQNQDPVNKESFIENYNDISEKDMLLYKDPTSENSLKNDKNCHRANANNINCELVPNDQLDYTIPNPNLPRKLVPFKIDNRERNRHLPNIIALPPPLHRLPIYNKILPGNAISQRQTCQNNATPMNKIGMSGTQDQLKLCITEPSHIEKSLGNNRVHKNDLPTQATLTTYNNKDARIKHYSYSTTKIDITAKNEDVTIVRKIKLDVDITEIRAQRDGFHRTRDRNEKSDKQICLNNLSVMSGKEVDVISSSQEIISVEKDNKVEEIKYSDSEISDLTIHKNNLLTIEPFQKPLGINNTHKDNERNYSSEFRSVTSTKSDQNIELVTNSVALIPFTQHNVDVIKENECKLTDTNCTNLVINAPDMETIISKKDCFVSTIADKFSSQKHTAPSIQLNQENKNIETSEDHQTDVRIYDNSNNNSLKKENYRLGSILQKYSKILRKTDSGSLSQIQSQSKVSYNNSSTLASSQKPKKPFKISEIQNYKIPLSKLQISEAVQREKNKLLPIKEKTEMRINEEQNSPTFTQEIPVECVKSPPPESNKWKTNQNCTFNEVSDDDIEDNTEEEICEVNLEEIDNDAQEQQSGDNFDIDQNMFNPKKLIECFNTDEPDMSIIIPPPLEFCDESNLTSEEENTVPLESYEPTNWDNPNESIFQDNSNIELTPEKEIETWILSQNDQGLNYTAPSNFNISRQSFTILHTPRQRSSQLQNVSATRENISGSRQNKLGQFKFSHKKKFVPK